MNRVDGRLSELLHAAVPERPAGVTFETVAGAVRRRRARRAATVAGTLTAVAALGAATALTWPPAGREAAIHATRLAPVPPQPDVMSAADAAVLRACDPGPLPGHEPDTYRVVASAPAPGGGYHALLLGKQTTATCVIDSRIPDGSGGSLGTLAPGTRDWIGGDLTVDGGHTERGGVTVRDGTVIRPPKQVLQVVVGRVSDRVAKVTFTGVDGASVSVAPVRGGFVASLYTAKASAKALRGPNGTNEVIGTVSAFDAAGKRLEDVDPEAPPSCYVLPNGNELGSDSSPPQGTPGCKPATRWKW